MANDCKWNRKKHKQSAVQSEFTISGRDRMAGDGIQLSMLLFYIINVIDHVSDTHMVGWIIIRRLIVEPHCPHIQQQKVKEIERHR